MTLVSWAGGVSGDWSVAADWSPHVAPNAASYDVSINSSGVYTVSIATSESYTVDSVTLNASGATLAINGNLTLGGATAALNLMSGNLQLGGTITGGAVNITGGSMTMSAASTYGGAFNLSAATLKLNSRSLTLSGAASFAKGAHIDGLGTLTTAGIVTIADPGDPSISQLNLGAQAQWSNGGVVNDGGRIGVGDAVGQSATFVNKAGASFNLTSDDANIVNNSTNGVLGNSTFTNSGVLAKTGGTGVSVIHSSMTQTSTGSINVVTGTLQLDAGGNYQGALTGNGTLAFAAGTSHLLSGASLTVQNVLIDGGALSLSASVSSYNGVMTLTQGSLTLGGALILTGNYYQTAGKINLNASTLTLAGNSFIATTQTFPPTNSIFIDSGSLATSGVFEVSDPGAAYNGLTLGGALQWTNTGRVYDAGAIGVGDAAGLTGAIVNAGLFDLTTDDAGIDNAASGGFLGTSAFNNQSTGTLEKTGGLGASVISSKMTSTGIVDVVTGTLQFDGGGVFSGVIEGNGVIDFDAGNFSLQASSSIKVGHLNLTGGKVTLASNFTSYAGTVKLSAGAVTLGANLTLSGFVTQTAGAVVLNGDTLTLTSTARFGSGPVFPTGPTSAVIDGAGSLVTSGSTQILDPAVANTSFSPDAQLRLGGGVTWINNGTVNDSGAIYVGDASGNSAVVTNSAGKVFNIVSDDGGVFNASYIVNGIAFSGNSTFNNAGSLIKSGGSGTSQIYSRTNSTGVVRATTGTLEFDGGGKFSGSFVGTGAIAFAAGVSAVSLTGLSVANLTVDGGAVQLTAPTANFAGGLNISSGALTLQNNFTETGGLSFTGGDLTLNGNFTYKGVAFIGSPPTYQPATGYGELDGPGNFNTSYIVNVLDPAYYAYGNLQNGGLTQWLLGGGVTWTNSGIVNDGGDIAAGDAAGGEAAIVNTSTGKFYLVSDDGGVTNNRFNSTLGSSTFANAGLLAKTGGTGTSNIWSSLSDTGTVSVTSGTLELDGGGSFTGGTLSGAGAIAFGAGVFALDANTHITAGGLLFDGAVVNLPSTFMTYAGAITIQAGQINLGANLTAAGSFAQTGGDISLLGANFTLKGAAVFGNPPAYNGAAGGGAIDGLGSFITQGATTIVDPGYLSYGSVQYGENAQLTLGGDVTWTNSGIVSDAGSIYVGDGAGLNAAFDNLAGGQFNLSSDDANIFNAIVGGQVGQSTFTNEAGATFAKTGGDGVSTIYAQMTDAGTTNVLVGTLDFENGGAFTGAITGAGAVQFDSGAAALSGAASLSVGQIDLTGGSLEIGKALTYAGVFEETGGELSIDSGDTFTLSSFGYYSGGGVDGSGTLAVTGQLTLAGGDLANGLVSVGSGGSIVGAGTIGPRVGNSGLIEATGGNLVVGGAIAGAGVLQIDPNSQLELQHATAETVKFNGPGGSLLLDAPTSFTGALAGLGAGDVLALGNTKAVSAIFANGGINVTLPGAVVDHFAVTGSTAGLSIALSVQSGVSYLNIAQAA